MKWTTAALIALCTAPAAAAEKIQFLPTPELILAVESRISDELSDPWSAEFKGLSASQDAQGRTYFCGLVNAKNRSGGYAGWTPFFVMADTISPPRFRAPMVGGQYAPKSVAAVCRTYKADPRRE